MFKIRMKTYRMYLFGLLFAGVTLGLTFGIGSTPQRASAGGAPAPARCSIDAWPSPSNPLSWGFRMTAIAPDATPGSLLPGHPGIYSPWTPYLTSPGHTYFNTYTTPGNKTVYGRFSYVRQGTGFRTEVQCSWTITATAPTTPVCRDVNATNFNQPLPCRYIDPLCTDPAAINFNGPLPCEYITGLCTDPAATNFNRPLPCEYITGGVCTDPAATNFNQPLPCRYPIPDPLCTDPAAINFGGTLPCVYRGCTNPAATNYNPNATVDDGSCDFPDVCANISGDQLTLPFGFEFNGSDCIFPDPSCTPAAAIGVYVNEQFRSSVRVRNNSSAGIGGVNASYNGQNGIAGSPLNNGFVGGYSEIDITGNAHTSATPIAGTISWTISYSIPAPLGGTNTITCAQDYRVTYRPPTCSVIGIVDPTNPEVGERFRVRVRVQNPNAGAIQLTNATYELQNTTPGENLSGSAESGQVPRNFAANATVELQSAQNITVSGTSLDINVVWTVTADSGSVTCELPDDVTVRQDIRLIAPTCTISPRTAVVGVPFIATVSVRNPNRFAPLRLLDSGVEYRVDDGQEGQAEPVGGWASGQYILNANGLVAVETLPPGVTIMTSGDHSVSWSINSEAGYATGACDLRAANGVTPPPPGTDGPDDPPVAFTLSTQPYARFYGNDVFAGGAYGETCTVGSDNDARGNGFFSGGSTQAAYRGTAAELAVFAIGEINGVLPGSQDVARPSLSSLSFSNQSLVGSGTLAFGGQFANALCADDYWAERPGDTSLPPTTVDSTTGMPVINITTLASGVYYFDRSVHLTTNQAAAPNTDVQIPAGRKVTLYVDGDVWIGDTSYNGARARQIAYAPGPWANMSDIPLVRVISRGSMYVDNNVSQLDGLYVAMPNPSDGSSGEIHTCALADGGFDLRNPVLDQVRIGQNCARQLLVNGGFIAKKVHLLRTAGNIGNAAAAPEPYTSDQIAEVFRFSPELYLALIAQGRGAANAEFDAIRSLPPAL